MTVHFKYAYVRVSSKEQNVDRQLETMRKLGIRKQNIFIDKASGKDFNREQYQLLKEVIERIKEDEIAVTVVFDSISRMGRDMEQTKEEYKWFMKKGISLEFINEAMLNYDADTKEDDTIKKAMTEVILTLLTAFAQKEREDIRQRQAEGIAVAKAQGKHLGRPRASLTAKQKAIMDKQHPRLIAKEISSVQLMELLGIKKSTYYKLLKEYEVYRMVEKEKSLANEEQD